MQTQSDKAIQFRTLHEQDGCFILPNAWDVGTTRVLDTLGFEAIATTSLGLANSLGRRDSTVSREEVLANCREMARATQLPINADLENGFAHDPKEAGDVIRLAAEAGVVGGSIEDYTGDPSDPIYDFDLSVARVRAAVEAARSLPFPFVLTARAENLIRGRSDLADTIKRLQAYEAEGADVLYAPGLKNLGEIGEVLSCIHKPFNVVTGWLDPGITAADLAEAGVRRISVGGALSRFVLAKFIESARALREDGSFAWMADMAPIEELQDLFSQERDGA